VTTTPAVADASAPDGSIFGRRPRRIDISSSTYSVFEDDTWRLDPIVFAPHSRTTALNFGAFPASHKLSAKRLVLALLTEDIDGENALPAPATVVGVVTNLRFFANWLAETHRPSVRELTTADLDAYRLHLEETVGKKPGVLNSRLRAVRLFHIYRRHLDDGLDFDPHTLTGWNGRFTRKSSKNENRTPRIPEEVSIPLVTWATRFVVDFADDIISSRREYIELADRGRKVPAHLREIQTTEERIKSIRQVIDRYVAAQRPLPLSAGHFGHPAQVNLNQLSREAGAVLEAGAAMDAVRSGIEAVGLDDDTYIWHENRDPILRDIAGPRFRYAVIARFASMLVAACYILIAFYSGMRDSEIKSLQRGCLSIERDKSGELEVVRVRGLAFKGESDPSGVPAEWVVGRVVEHAVRVLETLRADDGEVMLFAPLRRGGQAPRSKSRVVTSAPTTRNDLRHFMRWVNSYAGAAGRSDLIPDVDGEDWPLHTKHFRRTLAWFIARRPGGSIAGAIQYRHHSVQMFEGYAGTARSGFRAEVESEEAILRGEFLLELSEGDKALTGPAAAIAQSRADGFAAAASFAGIVAENPVQLERLVNAKRPAVYSGLHVICVFDRFKALCVGDDEESPEAAECVPVGCQNVALDEEGREYWSNEKAEADEALTKELSPFVRTRLEARSLDIGRLLGSGSR
jgi:integrase